VTSHWAADIIIGSSAIFPFKLTLCTRATARLDRSEFLAKLGPQSIAIGELQAMLGPTGTVAVAASPEIGSKIDVWISSLVRGGFSR
jgi:hypothetical protein